jgi:uncharacterized protein YjbI with pentapeptide repeats
MEIKIVSRYDSSKVLLCGKYESVKECLEKNRGANLWGAYLGGAYLEGANLRGTNLEGADLRGTDLRGTDLRGTDLEGAYLEGTNLRGTDLRGTNLRGTDLGGAYLEGTNLRGANLRGTNLWGTDLGGAYLEGAKNYLSSHDFFQEIVKRQPLKDFTEKEWAMIGQILVHRLCWDSIKKRYAKKIIPVFKKLSEKGFGEWEAHYKTV